MFCVLVCGFSCTSERLYVRTFDVVLGLGGLRIKNDKLQLGPSAAEAPGVSTSLIHHCATGSEKTCL